jgi:hypothetical protein
MRLIELCSGSAQITAGLLGLPKLAPWMGGKFGYRDETCDLLGIRRPDDVVMFDVNPWPEVYALVSKAATREALACKVEGYISQGPRALYDSLHKHAVPGDVVARCAEFLILQTIAFGGKPVENRGGVWMSPGFKAHIRGGCPLPPNLDHIVKSARLCFDCDITGHVQDVRAVDPSLWVGGGEAVVYFDPPYAGTTGYTSADLNRDEVIDIAQRWHDAGALVIVAEGEPVPVPGWQSFQLVKRHGKGSTLGSAAQKKQEWVTVSPGVQRPQLTMWG